MRTEGGGKVNVIDATNIYVDDYNAYTSSAMACLFHISLFVMDYRIVTLCIGYTIHLKIIIITLQFVTANTSETNI